MNSFSFSGLFNRSTLYLALLTAWVAMLGSLYFSNVLGYLPCDLCWYQRILMYPLAGILTIGILRRDEDLPYYVLPLSLIGQGLSTYHYLLQKTQIFGTTTACMSGVPCNTMWINWLGFITIPFLAMSAFFIITVLSLLAITLGQPEPDHRHGMPWIPVVALIGLVLVTFGAMARQEMDNRAALTLLERPAGELTPVTAASPSTETTVDTGAGATLYAQACAVCHGADGQGLPNLGNSLVESEIVNETSDADAIAFIRAGVSLTDARNTSGLVMPPSGGRPDLDDDELRAILTYLRNR